MTDNRAYCVTDAARKMVGMSAVCYSTALTDAVDNPLVEPDDLELFSEPQLRETLTDGMESNGYRLQCGTCLSDNELNELNKRVEFAEERLRINAEVFGEMDLGEAAMMMKAWAWMQSHNITFAQLVEMRGNLTYRQLRDANTKRLPLFKNRRGEPAHSMADGSDWSLGDWVCAVTGELGETANLIKKVQRNDVSLDEARSELAKELADVACYLDILAFRCGVDLGVAVASKFNEVSRRVGCEVFLPEAIDAAQGGASE